MFSADACLAVALEIVPQLSKAQENSHNAEQFLTTYIKNFLSVLLVVPDSPNHGVLNLMRILLNTIKNYDWESQSSVMAYLFLSVLDVLSALCQEEFPYHIDKS